MADDIVLSSATRSNLLSLNRTSDLVDRTQFRLSTGREVNSALDDAISFFKSRALTNRASDLATLKDGIDKGLKTLEAATQALESTEDILKQMKAVAEAAKSTATSDSTSRQKLASQFNELRSQVDLLTSDASYDGVNLIKSGPDTLTVKFSESNTSATLTINGLQSDSGTAGLNLQSANVGDATSGWGNTVGGSGGFTGFIDSDIEYIDSALTEVRDNAQQFGTNASLLEIRGNFTEELINTLEGGASDLVNADLNEESANLLSLQTRQQLGTISLSIAQQSEQAVLRLF